MKMDELIEAFPKQLLHALEIAENSELKSSSGIRQVLISGLGGSGIGGTIVSQWADEDASVPILVNKDYEIPAWVGTNTLLIASSYSGNTEETLNALRKGIENGARIVCISSGGELERIAHAEGLDHIAIPPGYPPRAAMAYSIVQLLHVLRFHGILPASFDPEREIQASAKLLELEQQVLKDHAQDLAEGVQGKRPVIYAESSYEGVAVRWRQQFNENAKTLCWHHVLPEMNHNELVGWQEGSSNTAVLALRSGDEHPQTQKRMELCKEFIQEKASWSEVHSKGETRIQRSLYLIHLGDWLSYKLATLKGVDPVEVDVIERFKKRLAGN